MNDSPVTPSLRPAFNIQHGDPASLSSPPAGYGDLLLEIKTQIRQRQFQALRVANKELLALYWRVAEISWDKNLLQRV